MQNSWKSGLQMKNQLANFCSEYYIITSLSFYIIIILIRNIYHVRVYSSSLLLMLVIHCYIAITPKSSGLKHLFHLLWVRNVVQCPWAFCFRISHWKSKCWLRLKLSQGSSGELSTFTCWKVLYSCWLIAVLSFSSCEPLQYCTSVYPGGQDQRARARVYSGKLSQSSEI